MLINNLVTIAVGLGLTACGGESSAPREASSQETPMTQSIPALPQAADLAGRWRLAIADRAECQLTLDPTALDLGGPNAPAWRLNDDAGCLAHAGVGEAAGWRPAPDGIALIRADGRVILFLSRQGETYAGRGPAGEAVTLTRE